MYIPGHQEQQQQQQQQQPEQTMATEMVQAMLWGFMCSAAVAGFLAVIAAFGYCVVHLNSRDRNKITTARGRYGDTRYIYSMTAPPIPYVMSEAAAQSGRAHHDIHTPIHGGSQFSMKELYDMMRNNIFSSDSDGSNAKDDDDCVNQYSSLLANADFGQHNSSFDSFGTTTGGENVAPTQSEVAEPCVS
ncbi:uncharacterized protein PpBr36_09807 [Pyricularia pennisetigena]|uniref:uncharacterized protein n=1 Tax=Pyricularia pennisetigena TaxID=1578925 RepID=UPI00114F8E1D|nr:uncharacterized protein PpBr36_09807 [Pyricularia pennisetigena]TLS22320.1 hypothetical protein PpBr36_09807 [Pyricularia pennisetigena]